MGSCIRSCRKAHCACTCVPAQLPTPQPGNPHGAAFWDPKYHGPAYGGHRAVPSPEKKSVKVEIRPGVYHTVELSAASPARGASGSGAGAVAGGARGRPGSAPIGRPSAVGASPGGCSCVQMCVCELVWVCGDVCTCVHVRSGVWHASLTHSDRAVHAGLGATCCKLCWCHSHYNVLFPQPLLVQEVRRVCLLLAQEGRASASLNHSRYAAACVHIKSKSAAQTRITRADSCSQKEFMLL